MCYGTKRKPSSQGRNIQFNSVLKSAHRINVHNCAARGMTNAFPIALPMCFDPETKLLNLRYVTQSFNGFNAGVGENVKMLEYLN